MKRIAILIIVTTLSVVVFGQSESRVETQNEVKKYIETTVFPELQKQQTNYINQLSENESKELERIKSEIGSRKEKNGRNNQNCNNQSHRNGKNRKGYGNLGQPNYLGELSSITDQHQDLNTSYEKFIEKNKQKWMDDISKFHDNNNVQPRKNNDGNTRTERFFQRMSNPEWLLLWDSSNSGMFNSRTNRFHSNGRNKSQGRNCMNSGNEYRNQKQDKFMSSVAPVIADERLKFDNNLSNSERETIETTRQKIEVRRIMLKNWRGSEDFEPGQRANDPNFDGMREDMRNSMAEVRNIALEHKIEIDSHLDAIRSNSEEWESALYILSEKPGNKPNNFHGNSRQNRCSSNTAAMFLLFDPNKLEESGLSKITEGIQVNIYPNPVVKNAMVVVTGMLEKDVQINMYSKDGELVRSLFDGKSTDERLEVTFNTELLENGIYLLKVQSEGNDLSRKIVISK